MKIKLTKIFLLLFILVSFFIISYCTSNSGPNNNNDDEIVNPTGCDPDDPSSCTDDIFICTDDGYGGKICRGQKSTLPDNGDWQCTDISTDDGNYIECKGDHIPENADENGWICIDNNGDVTCKKDAYYPDIDIDGEWDCYTDGEFRVCEYHDDNNDDAGGDADGDSDGDTDTDADGDTDTNTENDTTTETDAGTDTETGCQCVPGAMRYCDGALACGWGTQICDENMRWGECVENSSNPPSGCVAGGFDQSCCMRENHCCQDYWDIDEDGDLDESFGNCEGIVCETI